MNHDLARRPRVSRETRLLLITALLSVVALWILARIRFPDQPAGTPVQPIFTQLAPRPALDSLASEIAQLRPRLEPLLAGSALRVRDDAAITLLDTNTRRQEGIIGFDPASRLAVINAPFLPAPPPVPWTPRDAREPRYLIASDVSTGTVTLRPVFVGSLVATRSATWAQPIWLIPTGTGLTPGAFVFTTDALLAGMVIDEGPQLAILPGTALLAEADRLFNQPSNASGELGVQVQELAAPIARATGASHGVVVTQVDPNGPSADALAIGDVLEAVDGTPLETPLHWKALIFRLMAGQSVSMRVRRNGQSRELTLTAAPARALHGTPTLGLELRNMPGTGSAIARVEIGSIADRAGLRAGDVITLAGGTKAPSPAAVMRTIERASAGEAVLVAFVRDGTHAVTALEK
ncbi:MAG TPA: PDZ domain-containing protein [Vicinamibacterales bacterium]